MIYSLLDIYTTVPTPKLEVRNDQVFSVITVLVLLSQL